MFESVFVLGGLTMELEMTLSDDPKALKDEYFTRPFKDYEVARRFDILNNIPDLIDYKPEIFLKACENQCQVIGSRGLLQRYRYEFRSMDFGTRYKAELKEHLENHIREIECVFADKIRGLNLFTVDLFLNYSETDLIKGYTGRTNIYQYPNNLGGYTTVISSEIALGIVRRGE